jgi:plasmid stability protein
MAVDISIKGVPESLAEALRRRAARHHRSVQEEVLGILQASVPEERPLTFSAFVAEGRAQGISTPGESAAMVREDRGAGHRSG